MSINFFNSIKTRLITNVILVHMVLMGFIVFDMLEREKSFMHDQLNSRGKDLTSILASNAGQHLLNNDIVALNELIADMQDISNLSMVFIIDKHAKVRASQPSVHFNRKLNDEVSTNLIKTLKSSDEPLLQRQHHHTVDTLQKIMVDGQTIGYARTIFNANALEKELALITYKGVIYILIAIIIGALFAWLSVKKMTARLNTLTLAARSLANHQFDINIPRYNQNDEVAQMSHAFEVMQDSIKDYIHTIDANEKRLNLALEGSSDGLWDWDIQNDEIYFSPRWKEMLGYDEDELTNTVATWESLIHPDDKAKSLHYLEDFLHSDKVNYETRFRLRSKHKQYVPILSRGKKVFDDDGKIIRMIGTHVDLSEITQAQEKLRYQAEHDSLTGLPNRVLFHDRLIQAMHHSKRNKQLFAVLFLDLDHFKEVNDSFGHDIGDALLIRIATILEGSIRGSDTISRFGGDEFAIILENIENENKVINVVDKIQQNINVQHQIENSAFFTSFSIGIAIYPMDGEDPSELLKNADSAMYKAKKTGRNTYEFYTSDMTAKAMQRVTMEAQLRSALFNDELQVYFQPQISLHNNEIIGLETLIRWPKPEGGFVPPDSFIPLAEETGLITQIDIYVLKSCIKQIALWKNMGLKIPVIALNISMIDLTQGNYISIFETQLKSNNCSPSHFEIEITESLFMKDPEQIISQLNHFRNLGTFISIDDFGTGYSSLAYIKKLPITKLKIDKSFVDDIAIDDGDELIIKTIIDMAHNLQLSVIAEGVETQAQLDFLKAHGCDEVQGYYYYAPMSAHNITSLLNE